MNDFTTSKIILTSDSTSTLDNLESRAITPQNMVLDFNDNDQRENKRTPLGAIYQEDEKKLAVIHSAIKNALTPLIHELKEAFPLIVFNFIIPNSLEQDQIKKSIQLNMSNNNGIERKTIDDAQKIIINTLNETNRIIREINLSVDNKKTSQIIICSNHSNKETIKYITYLNKNSSLITENLFNTLDPLIFLLLEKLTIGLEKFKFETPDYKDYTTTSDSTKHLKGTICLESGKKKSFTFHHDTETPKNKNFTVFCEENLSHTEESLFEKLKSIPPTQVLTIEVKENADYIIHEDHYKPKLLIISFQIIQADFVQMASGD